MTTETIQQARDALNGWYSQIMQSLQAHQGRLGQDVEATAEGGQFALWLEAFAASDVADDAHIRQLQQLHGQLLRQLDRLRNRQQNFMKSRLAYVGIERSYLQLSDCLLKLDGAQSTP
jgi:hypothetical protein